MRKAISRGKSDSQSHGRTHVGTIRFAGLGEASTLNIPYPVSVRGGRGSMFHSARAKLMPWLMMSLSSSTVSLLRLGVAIVGLAIRGLR